MTAFCKLVIRSKDLYEHVCISQAQSHVTSGSSECFRRHYDVLSCRVSVGETIVRGVVGRSGEGDLRVWVVLQMVLLFCVIFSAIISLKLLFNIA